MVFREIVYCLLVIKQNPSETMDVLSDLLNCTERAFSKEPKKKKTGESFQQEEMEWDCSWSIKRQRNGSSVLVKHCVPLKGQVGRRAGHGADEQCPRVFMLSPLISTGQGLPEMVVSVCQGKAVGSSRSWEA